MKLKEAWSLYLDHFLIVVLIGATIVFPLELVSFTFSSFTISIFGLTGVSVFISLMIKVFILNLIQIPFIYLASRAVTNQNVHTSCIYFTFVMNLVPVFIMNVYYILCVAIGSVFLVLPGIFMLILTCLYPYVSVIEQKQGWDLFKGTYQLGRSQCVEMGLIMFSFVCLHALIWSLTTNALGLFHANFLTLILIHLVLNSLLVPFFVFLVVLNYFEWSEKSWERLEKIGMQS